MDNIVIPNIDHNMDPIADPNLITNVDPNAEWNKINFINNIENYNSKKLSFIINTDTYLYLLFKISSF